jgi:hypothetical protein
MTMTETTTKCPCSCEEDRRYYCASCVTELVNEGIAEASDVALLLSAPAGHTSDWCRYADATLMEGDE